jgi:hypothetical protein
MFETIKLYFTNKSKYEQIRRYIKRQKSTRKLLKKLAKNFSPWSGNYMHEVVVAMLKFYHETYLLGDNCYSEEGRLEEIATALGVACDWADKIEDLDILDDEELLSIAQEDEYFMSYVADWEKKVEICLAESSNEVALKASLALEFLIAKYTKNMYNIIGEHIWEWYD